MKEKLKLLTVASACFVAFALVLFAFYVSGNLEPKKEPAINASIIEELFNDTETFTVDTPGKEVPVIPDTAEKIKKTVKPQKLAEQKKDSVIAAPEIKVIICNSVNAQVYHAYECNGLKNCKAERKTITKTEAENMGRRECRNCY